MEKLLVYGFTRTQLRSARSIRFSIPSIDTSCVNLYLVSNSASIFVLKVREF